jgi:hypothetical protein
MPLWAWVAAAVGAALVVFAIVVHETGDTNLHHVTRDDCCPHDDAYWGPDRDR